MRALEVEGGGKSIRDRRQETGIKKKESGSGDRLGGATHRPTGAAGSNEVETMTHEDLIDMWAVRSTKTSGPRWKVAAANPSTQRGWSNCGPSRSWRSTATRPTSRGPTDRRSPVSRRCLPRAARGAGSFAAAAPQSPETRGGGAIPAGPHRGLRDRAGRGWAGLRDRRSAPATRCSPPEHAAGYARGAAGYADTLQQPVPLVGLTRRPTPSPMCWLPPARCLWIFGRSARLPCARCVDFRPRPGTPTPRLSIARGTLIGPRRPSYPWMSTISSPLPPIFRRALRPWLG